MMRHGTGVGAAAGAVAAGVEAGAVEGACSGAGGVEVVCVCAAAEMPAAIAHMINVRRLDLKFILSSLSPPLKVWWGDRNSLLDKVLPLLPSGSLNRRDRESFELGDYNVARSASCASAFSQDV